MLYICIPTHDEAPTVGVLLWRIRKVFQDYPREYEILVYDDASADGTREVLEPYAKTLPLTVLGGTTRVGYARAVDALLREAAERTRYPRRDAALLMQADFTDRPEDIPEFVKRFEGGADVVVGERTLPGDAPVPVQQLHRWAGWIPKLWPLRRGGTVPGLRDPWGSMRLLRIATVRDLLRDGAGRSPDAVGDAGATWQANLELLVAAAPHARRIESVPVTLRYDVRMRETRRQGWPDAWGLAKAAWANRGRRVEAVAVAAPTAVPAPAPRRSEPRETVRGAEPRAQEPRVPESRERTRRERTPEPALAERPAKERSTQERPPRERPPRQGQESPQRQEPAASERPPQRPTRERPERAPQASTNAAPDVATPAADAEGTTDLEGRDATARSRSARKRRKRGARRGASSTAAEPGVDAIGQPGVSAAAHEDTHGHRTTEPEPEFDAMDAAEGGDEAEGAEGAEGSHAGTQPAREGKRRGRRRRGRGSRNRAARNGQESEGGAGEGGASVERTSEPGQAPVSPPPGDPA